MIPEGELSKELVSRVDDDGMQVTTERWVGEQKGAGSLKIDFLLYGLMGVDLSNANKATLETLRLPTRLLLPFVVLFFAQSGLHLAEVSLHWIGTLQKMNTPVQPDPEADEEALELAFRDPAIAKQRKLFSKFRLGVRAAY